eukprot:30926-Pelagococcus_subviridis.AAC.6
MIASTAPHASAYVSTHPFHDSLRTCDTPSTRTRTSTPLLSIEIIHRSSTRGIARPSRGSLNAAPACTAPLCASRAPYLVLSSARTSSTEGRGSIRSDDDIGVEFKGVRSGVERRQKRS